MSATGVVPAEMRSGSGRRLDSVLAAALLEPRT